ncbi:hypothetical protein [Pseudoalteromonas sp. Of7M-16]|uniref:hypothetical protein n=1 Tax=Pseudoalteromonas sp. Of7M-16 TaxID=2917756 RepID=UPI001EF66A9E|nr:hypothetical protein [Pseudoalteromonas sp. Of7M-16]MCG7546952.1 hypothetical protein [Pseudoalteromonas sp. Of7M-16]
MIEFEGKKILLDGHARGALMSLGASELEADELIKSAVKIEETKVVIEQRQQAYNREADPLFIEYQFDQTAEAEQAWREKVLEIKARYPKP